ncbi:class I SAM-dependent methyltransferase [Paracoccus aerodenitrificans]|uniref:class I SAM-dependent methyltransferase n=1 Tax=Paracoccus aerodenitrificans TaxID=3017781 RepID=UPI0022F07ECA|nr:SAM-dependent methyltransferase [Paracoccus aerodenitrificans]WBU64474.1 SAM-dependent methyltransferase [Paracoccus aerodenitrificans]
MTPLFDLIADEIRRSGPVSVARYMGLCLLHPDHGYYATRDPFGASGDFTTAPEISQIFGELLGLFLGQAWLDQNAPAPFTLAEIGPGRGTLMADMRRAMSVVPGMADAARLHLVEASPHLRRIQSAKLGRVVHLDSVDALPDQPLFLVANEFLDALPIRQFQKTPNGWSERLIGISGDSLAFGLGPVMDLDLPGQEGEVIERCAPAGAIIGEVGRRICESGGVAVFIDYGGWNGRGDTFQALAGHKPVDPLARPGEADLTAHVDFAPLALAASRAGCEVGYTTQGALLRGLGVDARAARLTAAGDKGAIAAARRLTRDDEMGELFKVLAIWPRGAPAPAGFDVSRNTGKVDADR